MRPPGSPKGSSRSARREVARVAAERALRHFARAAEIDVAEDQYAAIDAALADVIGHRLLTVLKLDGPWLRRVFSSDLQHYPPGGAKDIRGDPWLQTLLAQGRPVITADERQLAQRFVDHREIVALGCGAVLNLPIVGPRGVLGSLNLLHQAHWFTPEHVLLARPFASLLALAWAAPP